MKWKAGSVLVLTGALFLGSSFMVCAEETEPAGYHVYETSEDEATDTWYGISRGAYLRAGIAKLTEGDSPNYAVCGGHTLAHSNCGRVYVRIYLDESDNGKDDWGTLDYWTGEAFDASTVSVSSGPYRITLGKYYSAKGVHSATKDWDDREHTTETTTTCTDALLFD